MLVDELFVRVNIVQRHALLVEQSSDEMAMILSNSRT